MRDRLNFDVNATTAVHPEVREQLSRLWADPELDGNPASAHQLGQKARACLEQARRRLAAAIDADPLSLVWTSGGTEANALALRGVVGAKRAQGLAHGVLSTALEHPCVHDTLRALADSGSEHRCVPVDAQGCWAASELLAALDENIGVVSTMLASHELGNLYPVQALATQLRQSFPELWLHCDAVQALGKCELSFAQLGAHSLALSAHKFGGPKGIGALLIERGSQITPQLVGGSQERGFRAGTPNVRLADAMALAAEIAVRDTQAAKARCGAVYTVLREALTELPGIRLLGDPKTHLGNTLCLLSLEHRGQDLMIALDLEGFDVSTGAACSVGASTASTGIMAMGYSSEEAKGVLRLSWGPKITPDHARELVGALRTVLGRMSKASGPREQGVLV